MKSLLIEDPDVFEKASGSGRLFMVMFSLPGSRMVRVLGIKVRAAQAAGIAEVLQALRLTTDEIEQLVAIHSVKLLLRGRGLATNVVENGRWHAEPTELVRFMEVYEHLKVHPLSHEGKWLIDLLVPHKG